MNNIITSNQDYLNALLEQKKEIEDEISFIENVIKEEKAQKVLERIVADVLKLFRENEENNNIYYECWRFEESDGEDYEKFNCTVTYMVNSEDEKLHQIMDIEKEFFLWDCLLEEYTVDDFLNEEKIFNIRLSTKLLFSYNRQQVFFEKKDKIDNLLKSII